MLHYRIKEIIHDDAVVVVEVVVEVVEVVVEEVVDVVEEEVVVDGVVRDSVVVIPIVLG